ncbi:MAG: class II fumarate hydratase [Candidatus Eisenbacteria bacterium]|uniref:Fumarate hydratase class II n=1 Tax=Eiseniibacteriota bacterium TaxID=2212470 RepID=A0A937X919_UNCEI|nr:class II fumarate hydratase [Candidatus Eisenbacteria bacterium]
MRDSHDAENPGAGAGTAATRIEHDAMGEIAVPAASYWGAQTQRALQQAPVSGRRMPEPLIRALGLIKRCAAETHRDLGLLDAPAAEAILRAASEVAAGRWSDHFPLDVLQTGSGTSTHMNANEVIANRANELLGAPLGLRAPVHPNDHVNLGQSSNDVFPSAVHIAARGAAEELLGALRELRGDLERKRDEFAAVVKPGRTHLQDAVPVTLGQEFSAYAHQIAQAERRLRAALPAIEELPLGGTAVGTGLGAHPEFAARTIARLAAETGCPLRPAPNRFEALAARDALVELMGAVNALAVAAIKIANDLRLLSSGPRTGLGELRLPALQPGSSIMPGKVNPVVPEIVMQAAAQAMGAHLAVTIGGQHGPLELNVMMPLIADSVLGSVQALARSLRLLGERCVRGIEADAAVCAAAAERSLALAMPLAALVGHDRAAAIARRALAEGRPVREVAVDEGLLTDREARELLDPARLSDPGK